jgi:GH35 family endo-1,4-beta-xylanase
MSESRGTNVSRRNYLKYIGVAAAGVAVGVAAGRYAWVPGSPEAVTHTATRSETVTQTVTETVTEALSCSSSLRAAADSRHLLVGAAASPEFLLLDDRYANTLAREFNFLTPENAMKWGQVHPTPDYWNFAPADALVKFASEHEMKVKGHAVIWDKMQMPSWVNSQMSSEELRRVMQEHIHTLVGRYRGRVYAWDVVNEAVDDAEGLRKGLFFQKLGEGYIADAFRLAHEADPEALLFYNDYNAEAAVGWRKDKSDRVYALVKKLLANEVPIHGVGLQMHITATNYPRPEDVAANIRRLAALGLKVNIGEMDVQIKDVPGDLFKRFEVQRQVYHDIIAGCLKEQGFIAVTFWGFTDAHSWIGYFFGPDDPLLFDENYQPKPAYWGVMDALLNR